MENYAMEVSVRLRLKALKFVIVHARTLPAQAIASLIERDHEFASVGVLPEADEAALRSLAPDIIIVDKEGDPDAMIAEVERAARACPSAQVCVLTNEPDLDLVQSALRAGADGYILKDVSPERLIDGLHSMYDNKVFVDERLSRAFLTTSSRQGPQGETALSQRERQVCQFIARGLTNRAIASALHVAENTVKNHVSSILSKLHLHSRTQIVIYAMRRGWH